jgi:hypothetical protein
VRKVAVNSIFPPQNQLWQRVLERKVAGHMAGNFSIWPATFHLAGTHQDAPSGRSILQP